MITNNGSVAEPGWTRQSWKLETPQGVREFESHRFHQSCPKGEMQRWNILGKHESAEVGSSPTKQRKVGTLGVNLFRKQACPKGQQFDSVAFLHKYILLGRKEKWE